MAFFRLSVSPICKMNVNTDITKMLMILFDFSYHLDGIDIHHAYHLHGNDQLFPGVQDKMASNWKVRFPELALRQLMRGVSLMFCHELRGIISFCQGGGYQVMSCCCGHNVWPDCKAVLAYGLITSVRLLCTFG